MIIKIYRGVDNSGRTREFTDISCDECRSVTTRHSRFLKETEGKHWCSPTCMSLLKGDSIKYFCAHCNSVVIKKKSAKSKSGLYFCNRKCKEEAQKYMKEIQPSHYGTGTGINSYRAKALRELGKICNRCGWDNILALVVHHSDRNRDNNNITNLEVLCANCHSIEHK